MVYDALIIKSRVEQLYFISETWKTDLKKVFNDILIRMLISGFSALQCWTVHHSLVSSIDSGIRVGTLSILYMYHEPSTVIQQIIEL